MNKLLELLRALFVTTAQAVPVAKKAAPAMFLAAAVFIAGWEGLYTHAYRDIVGVKTICYGHIEGVKMGDYKTPEECKKLLATDLPRYWAMVKKCVPNIDKFKEPVQVAMLSVTYNIGGGGFCKSSMARNLNSGKTKAACDSLLAWNKAGGRVIKGLTNRRVAERNLCLKGV